MASTNARDLIEIRSQLVSALGFLSQAQIYLRGITKNNLTQDATASIEGACDILRAVKIRLELHDCDLESTIIY